jgi:hypothetical protein
VNRMADHWRDTPWPEIEAQARQSSDCLVVLLHTEARRARGEETRLAAQVAALEWRLRELEKDERAALGSGREAGVREAPVGDGNGKEGN